MDTATSAIVIGLVVELRMQVVKLNKRVGNLDSRVDKIDTRTKLPAIGAALCWFLLVSGVQHLNML